MMVVRFKLRCLMCKHRWEEDVEEGRDESPPCPKCVIGVSIVEAVVRRVS